MGLPQSWFLSLEHTYSVLTLAILELSFAEMAKLIIYLMITKHLDKTKLKGLNRKEALLNTVE